MRAVILLAILSAASLAAEVFANDRPLYVGVGGAHYFPLWTEYRDADFVLDDPLAGPADFRDPILRQTLVERDAFVIWPPIRYSWATINREAPSPAPSPPFWLLDSDERCAGLPLGDSDSFCALGNFHWLGSDDQGRDVAARLLYGIRISLLFGALLTALSSVIGIAAGAAQGYYGGRLDLFMQRGIEIWTAIPSLYVLIILASALEPGFWLLLGVMLLFSWTALVGVVRAECLRARNFEYILAARALGVSGSRLMRRHLLPNAFVATMTFLPFLLSGSIATLTALDFLGFGMPPGSPSLGELLAQGKTNLQSPWLGASGFAAIACLLGLLVLAGEAARDAFDPRADLR